MVLKWLALVLIICLTAGCGTAARNETSPSPQQDPNLTVQQRGTQADIRDDAELTARHLEQLAMSIPGVLSARCVVIGGTAVVGIDVEENLERARVGTLKYTVAEAFRKDPLGAEAFVTADMDLAARIREIREDLDRGRPVAGFAEEMADIIGRIVPQLPRDTTAIDAPEAQTSGTSR
ncbi:YhcN/YlaJ family sporulation lipoprotein [Paenibacillus sambharensis]|uniref:YhcN/YlaJ family sporulation lipoprotein n=1 Tax=Paenibacillus sambharensis TaxID=1803190 RepID=A0A2W1L3V9_9BACL|nr:YhcN/YlaJ family sporulation lipoprotein [Paenibacillus sambharensis]PZD94036.1 YhcN/YlaJ family sporulation lipoprotein [Paenibacillus sambharensis]